MTKEEVARSYLSFLEQGKVKEIVTLFTKEGIVISPVYGTLPASEFYETLADDTSSSELTFDGLFYEKESDRISLLFDYIWRLKKGNIVKFKVVDILEMTSENKIKKLTIIYDTVHSREEIKKLRAAT
ncbi:nuclear transport factor 2 family protein [Aquimarina sp. RZ0]|uniref:nuclear transport factor 2 family protein n=1 Tax=Aquimarina sp. RZ0 TaxID=2607730 RepID=UPI0011F2E450|nr:nuclear transport factor 2 family protein [Aquimarina sp. RZ0]KAA1245051.1 nuclear transport factor 2 family protein [Aquimarina sp. RZ0]